MAVPRRVYGIAARSGGRARRGDGVGALACDAAEVAQLEGECRAGQMASCRRAGDFFFLRGDLDKARRHYANACAHDDGPACFASGALARQRNDSGVARAALTKGCSLGSAAACNELGIVTHEHTTDPAGPAQAYALYEKACTAGYAAGCENQGTMLRDGTAVPSDVRRAIALLERGCDGGWSTACFKLGLLHGKAGARVEALRAHLVGCDLRLMSSCESLGFVYYE